jgi:hypothetical protein
MTDNKDAIEKWVKFWNTQGIRFLGFGKSHIPDIEERGMFCFLEGYKAGAKANENKEKEATDL